VLMESLLAPGGDAAPPGVGAGEGAVGVSPERGGRRGAGMRFHHCGISSSATQGALCNMAEPRDPADTGAWLAGIYGTT
jgi:hypothetical protein